MWVLLLAYVSVTVAVRPFCVAPFENRTVTYTGSSTDEGLLNSWYQKFKGQAVIPQAEFAELSIPPTACFSAIGVQVSNRVDTYTDIRNFRIGSKLLPATAGTLDSFADPVGVTNLYLAPTLPFTEAVEAGQFAMFDLDTNLCPDGYSTLVEFSQDGDNTGSGGGVYYMQEIGNQYIEFNDRDSGLSYPFAGETADYYTRGIPNIRFCGDLDDCTTGCLNSGVTGADGVCDCPETHYGSCCEFAKPTGIPSAVVALTGEALSASSATISWEEPLDFGGLSSLVTQYRISWVTSTGSPTATVTNGLAAHATSMASDTDVEVCVYAFTDKGQGEETCITVRTAASTPPNAPSVYVSSVATSQINFEFIGDASGHGNRDLVRIQYDYALADGFVNWPGEGVYSNYNLVSLYSYISPTPLPGSLMKYRFRYDNGDHVSEWTELEVRLAFLQVTVYLTTTVLIDGTVQVQTSGAGLAKLDIYATTDELAVPESLTPVATIVPTYGSGVLSTSNTKIITLADGEWRIFARGYTTHEAMEFAGPNAVVVSTSCGCVHGTCDGVGCLCDDGWTGATCDQRLRCARMYNDESQMDARSWSDEGIHNTWASDYVVQTLYNMDGLRYNGDECLALVGYKSSQSDKAYQQDFRIEYHTVPSGSTSLSEFVEGSGTLLVHKTIPARSSGQYDMWFDHPLSATPCPSGPFVLAVSNDGSGGSDGGVYYNRAGAGMSVLCEGSGTYPFTCDGGSGLSMRTESSSPLTKMCVIESECSAGCENGGTHYFGTYCRCNMGFFGSCCALSTAGSSDMLPTAPHPPVITATSTASSIHVNLKASFLGFSNLTEMEVVCSGPELAELRTVISEPGNDVNATLSGVKGAMYTCVGFAENAAGRSPASASVTVLMQGCLPPPLGPEHSTFCTLGVDEGISCNVDCGPGFQGTSTSRTCSGASWTGSNPVCTLESCPPLVEIGTDVTVAYTGYSVDDTVTFSCLEGKFSPATATRTCQLGGTWSSEAMPTCSPLTETCSVDLPSFITTTCGADPAVGSTCIFVCAEDEGTDAQVWTCMSGNVWSPLVPYTSLTNLCPVKAAGKCLMETHDGLSNSCGTTSNPGDSCVHSCNSSYISASFTRVCGGTGEWSGIDPTCELVNVCPPVIVSGNDTTTCASETNAGQTCSLTRGTAAYVLTCNLGGAWTESRVPPSAATCATPIFQMVMGDVPTSGANSQVDTNLDIYTYVSNPAWSGSFHHLSSFPPSYILQDSTDYRTLNTFDANVDGWDYHVAINCAPTVFYYGDGTTIEDALLLIVSTSSSPRDTGSILESKTINCGNWFGYAIMRRHTLNYVGNGMGDVYIHMTTNSGSASPVNSAINLVNLYCGAASGSSTGATGTGASSSSGTVGDGESVSSALAVSVLLMVAGVLCATA